MGGDESERTIYSPGTHIPGQAPSGQPGGAEEAGETPPVQPALPQASGTTKTIKVGDVLNHLYEVRRLIARGGMGEVFEAANVSFAEERVAIKVILPHLAADQAVQSMFFKEARTLTRLSHPALVHYRTMAHEPQLGVFYIVTQFVDGPNLSDRLKELKADVTQLAALTRRLAEGLSAAHKLGAIHRDISPDNILLEGGVVEQAKIIDFGIAKDLDPGSATIVGDGFAGKLNYVAPEQLGEFGRDIGPWSDIYSLGLTILAVARGRDVDMGGSIVDAVDKRRAGPDLSPVPESLRPLLARMLAANPRDRMRSMDDVVQWLVDWSQGRQPAKAPHAGAKTSVLAALSSWSIAVRSRLPKLSALKEPRGMMIAGGIVLGVMLLAAVVLSFSSGGGNVDGNAAPDAVQAGNVPAKGPDQVARVRSVLASGLSGIPCSWMEVEAIEGGGGTPVTVMLKGVSGRSTDSIARVEQMLRGAGGGRLSVNYSDIAALPSSFCGPLEAFGAVRGGGVAQLSVPQIKFEMSPLQGNLPQQYIGQLGAKAIIEFDLKSGARNAALVGIGEAGEMQLIAADLRQLPKEFLEDLGGGRFRLYLPTTNTGWSGIVLLVGKGPFPDAMFNHPAGSIGGDWSQTFLNAARERGWKSEMVWYKAVNEQPDSPPAR